MENQAIKTFLTASADLLQQALEEARKEDPAGVEGLAAMLRAGGMVTLRATFAPSTHIAQIAVDVIEPNGRTHQLMNTDLQNSILQK